MDLSGYRFKSETFKRQLAEEIEKAVANARAEAVLLVLSARDIPVNETLRMAILACTDPSTLERWIQRSATASFAEDVLCESDLTPSARIATR